MLSNQEGTFALSLHNAPLSRCSFPKLRLVGTPVRRVSESEPIQPGRRAKTHLQGLRRGVTGTVYRGVCAVRGTGKSYEVPSAHQQQEVLSSLFLWGREDKGGTVMKPVGSGVQEEGPPSGSCDGKAPPLPPTQGSREAPGKSHFCLFLLHPLVSCLRFPLAKPHESQCEGALGRVHKSWLPKQKAASRTLQSGEGCT